jgi:uncharacterized protein YhhL (DUF1145 family)
MSIWISACGLACAVVDVASGFMVIIRFTTQIAQFQGTINVVEKEYIKKAHRNLFGLFAELKLPTRGSCCQWLRCGCSWHEVQVLAS